MMPNNASGATSNNNNDGSGGVGSGSGGSSSTLKKGPWTAAEDAILMEYVKKHGEGNWNAVQKNSGLSRCGKSCRLRWANHLRANLKKGSFSPEEERLILELHAKLGNKWARMAAQLPGRTDNEIKNYWNTRVKRRQRAGLPLYPQDIQKQAVTAAFHLNPQNNQPRPSSSVTPPASAQQPIKPNYGSPLSLLDSTPLLGHHHHHHPSPFLQTPFHRFKRFRENNSVGFSLPFSPTPQLNLPSPMFSQGFSTQFPPVPSFQLNSSNFDFNPPPPPPILGTTNPFESNSGSPFSMKLELPSSQQPLPADSATAALGITTTTSTLGRTNSGLLDALLQESQAIGGSEDSRKDNGLDGLVSLSEAPASGSIFCDKATTTTPLPSDRQWDDSNSAHSSAGLKTKKEGTDEMNSVDDDLSSFLDIIPSSMRVPEWYSDSGEMSNGQSSGVTDDEIGLEMQHIASSLSIPNNTDPDWASWNNMPGIC